MSTLQLAELRQKLEELHSSASADHLAKVDLESRQYRLHDDTSRLEKRLAAVEADRECLSQQLKVRAYQIVARVVSPDLSQAKHPNSPGALTLPKPSCILTTKDCGSHGSVPEYLPCFLNG